jgi:hypothetical protein
MTRPYPPSRELFPDWPLERNITPKEVLKFLADLNERYHGKFHRVMDEMNLVIDEIWQDHTGTNPEGT